ncbi:MAG: HAMP domain-containing histidine kinase, partial [Candidatus Kapabacteria bacterium]|nr:HAMP domain-containing histidine kinase [Candidatus Kapabacteria bacterium]MDW8224714.1 HAMP domain-containing sensor histidine kinase [Bacteroidota bacterium]
TIAVLSGLLLWYRSTTRRRLRTMAQQNALSQAVSRTAYDSLLAENSRLKAELNNLRGQISALEARSHNLQQENKSLRTQVERLSAKQEELEQLQEQKDALFAMLVHDIKNPALIIRSLVELLRSYDLSAQEQQEIINDIVATTTRIVELSQEISRILSLEAKILQLEIQPVDITEVIRQVCSSNRPLAERKSIALLQEIEPELPPISADPQRLEEVLDNLVSNAIKYSHPGATVIVRAYTRQSHMYVEVEDNGLGMSEEDVRHAFQRGGRLSAKPTAGEPSSGLGLWIVKRLVEAHHGHVRIRSALGKGTTVYVELPLEQPQSAESTA